MKKFFSITLLGLFLFQFIGCYFVYMGLRYRVKSDMMVRLDSRNYTEEETITIKIPFTLPYWMDSKEYERVDGEFQYQGEFYRLVEQKLEKDTLYVVCIRDVDEKKLNEVLTDYVEFSNDLPSSSQKNLKLLSNLMKDYVGSMQADISVSQGWCREFSFAEPTFPLLVLASPVYSPPPES